MPTIIIAIVQLFLSALLARIYSSSRNKSQILSLFLISFTLTAWTVINTILLGDYREASTENVISIINALGFFLGHIAIVQIYILSFVFPEKKHISSRSYLLIIIGIIFSLISLTPTISGSYYFNTEKSLLEYQNGDYYIAYLVSFVIFLSSFLFNTFRARIKDKNVKNQVNTVAFGLASTTIYGIIFIIIMPIIFGEKNIFYSLGYIAPIFFTVGATRAIVKHRLFEIRFFVVRAVAYLFSIVFLTLSVSIVFVLASNTIFINKANEITLQVQILSVVTSFIIALSYQPIKRWFDKTTRRIFYQDSYDSEVFLDSLNKSIVGNIEIDTLLKNTAQIIETNLKAEFVSFYILDTSYYKSRMVGDYKGKLDAPSISQLQDLLPKTRKKLISTQDEPASEEEKESIDILKFADIEVLARLVSTLDYEVHGVGYLLIGPKKSGNPYSQQDLTILEIISNELVIAIQNALRFEEIEQFNITLQQKIDKATKELQNSNEKLLALDEAKDEFVSMASHQLRTPLTSIKGYLSMVLEGDAGTINDTQKQMLSQAMFSSQRMVYLIADLLNVSRLKTGKFIIEPKPVYLPDLVESEISQLLEGAISKNITLAFVKPKRFPTINLDDMKTRQVVMNFTDNAIYYTKVGGKITLELKDRKDSVEFTVRDNGIGVPKEVQHKLFTKFYRADNARKARPDGTGLGLFMAKKVIIAQGGSIIFNSREGKGSTFGFSFPKKQSNTPVSVGADD